MRKRLLSLLTICMMLTALAAGCGAEDKEKMSGKNRGSAKAAEEEPVKVVLNEVAHSIFYAPMYVAVENGYFEEEGIELTVNTGFGAC